MAIHQGISVGNLLLDTSNRRNTRQDSQKAERDAIIAEQGRKLVNLAKDIIDHGLNPFDLPLVIDAEDGLGNFIVIEGNRRLTAISLMLKPELADGTPLHAAFKKLNRDHASAIPKVMECVISPSKAAGMIWIERKHASGLEGAGTEPWSAMAKARSDVIEGKPRPDLDAVNFVLSHSTLDPKVRTILEGSQFNITTLSRLIEAKEFQQEVGFVLQEGKIVSEQDKARVGSILPWRKREAHRFHQTDFRGKRSARWSLCGALRRRCGFGAKSTDAGVRIMHSPQRREPPRVRVLA